MQDIEVLAGQDLSYLNWQPGRQRDSRHRATEWNRERPAYSGNLFFEVLRSCSQAGSYDSNLMPHLDEMMGETRDVINHPAWEGIVIWGD